MNKFEKECIKTSNSFQELVVQLCNYGFFDKAGSDYPIPRSDIKRYLEIGAMFARKQIASEIDIDAMVNKMFDPNCGENQIARSFYRQGIEDLKKVIEGGK